MNDAELIDAYIQDQNRRGLLPNTVTMTTRQLRKFSAECGPFETVTHQAIDAWLDKRTNRFGAPITGKTRSSWLTSLSSFYTWAVREDQLAAHSCRLTKGHAGSHRFDVDMSDDPCESNFVHNPVSKIVRPRLHGHGPRPIDTGQLRRAIDAAQGDLRVWLTIEAYEGLRCQEVTFLAAEDFDREAMVPTLLITHGKGNKERRLPLHPEVVVALELWGNMPIRGRLFPRATPPAVSQRINRHLHKMGITSTAHTLRHWFGTSTYIATKDLRLTQTLMGHSSPQTTAGYADFDQTAAAAAVSSLSI